MPAGPAFGLTEDNANLLWSPAAAAPESAAAFLPARRKLTDLHPTYVRLLVDWASLQPDPDEPPALAAAEDGCAREIGPCGSYDGIAEELEAIASQQRTHPGSFQVVLDLFGVPAWAALSPHGCERGGDTSFSRPLRPAAIAGYRALIHGLLALGESKDVALRWWSPWNEPNDPRFIAPQRASCRAGGDPLAPGVYAQLAQAMAGELRSAGGERQLVLGELGGYDSGSPHRTGVAEFVRALPADVLCLGETWSVHAYAARDAPTRGKDPVRVLEEALDGRGGCAASARIWVTEAGAGAPEPGSPRPAGAEEERDGCLALATQALSWYADPRVAAVFQYTFRDDPDFPVGLASPNLSRLYPVYRMWLALTRARLLGSALPTPQAACLDD